MIQAIQLPFAIGDTYWRAAGESRQEEIVCPVCAGKRRITVILGDGEHVSVPCDSCGMGYEGPRGFVRQWTLEPKAVRFVIASIESMHNNEWRLRSEAGEYCAFSELLLSESAALAKAKEVSAANRERIMASRCSKRKPDRVGWTVRYHRQQIAELKKRLEWHEEKVQAGQ